MIRADGGGTERLADGGIALGMFAQSTYGIGRALLAPGDLLAVYSDGITEAENRDGVPFDERGLETALPRDASASASDLAQGVFRAVEQYRGRREARRRSHDPSASPIGRASGLI